MVVPGRWNARASVPTKPLSDLAHLGLVERMKPVLGKRRARNEDHVQCTLGDDHAVALRTADHARDPHGNPGATGLLAIAPERDHGQTFLHRHQHERCGAARSDQGLASSNRDAPDALERSVAINPLGSQSALFEPSKEEIGEGARAVYRLAALEPRRLGRRRFVVVVLDDNSAHPQRRKPSAEVGQHSGSKRGVVGWAHESEPSVAGQNRRCESPTARVAASKESSTSAAMSATTVAAAVVANSAAAVFENEPR